MLLSPTLCERWKTTMSEILLSDGASTTVLPETDAEKARQVPDPVTYHLLCMLPKADEEYESGLIKSGQTMHFEEVMSPVLFVAKMGPDCYKDPLRFPSGPSCKVGDFVLVRPNTGTRLKIHGTEFRIINDDSVEAVVMDPRGIQKGGR
jgi:co-chaperonin GroES (HSP10)